MTQATADRRGLENREASPHLAQVAAGVVGVLASITGLWVVQPLQFNVVTYEAVNLPVHQYLPSDLFAGAILLGIIAAAIAGSPPSTSRQVFRRALSVLSPMILCVPLASYAFVSGTPPFLTALPFILGCGWAAFLAGRRLDVSSRSKPFIAVLSLVALTALLTVVHTRIEINYFDHFMFGHADIGHFTEELKNALIGRGLRSDSFDNTRLGWHFVPLQYVLVFGYLLWPSPRYLMMLGPLVLHLGALPAYWLARRRSGSVLVGWLFGLAWLALPSLSRLVYSNTYGFAWLYCSVPLLCGLLAAASMQYWKPCWLLVAVLLLCRETNAAVTLGFGLYLTAFSPRRNAGLLIVLASILYGILCATVFIPHFAVAGRYERLNMFGELGDSMTALAFSPFTRPGLFFGRLVRPQSLYLIFLLLTTLFFLPLRGWRLALAAVPTVLAHLLLEGTDWLSIKFWHHAMVLPFLFFAAISILRVSSTKTKLRENRSFGLAFAFLVCAALGHYFFGFSPLSKSYEVYASDSFLQNPDPRLAFTRRMRNEIPLTRTILATERLAAHFTDYRRLYTGRRFRQADFVILDRSDGWDSSGLPARWQEFAADANYQKYAENGPIIVFERRADAPPAPPDP